MLKLYRLISFKLDLTCCLLHSFISGNVPPRVKSSSTFPNRYMGLYEKDLHNDLSLLWHSLFTLLEVQFNSVVPNFYTML